MATANSSVPLSPLPLASAVAPVTSPGMEMLNNQPEDFVFSHPGQLSESDKTALYPIIKEVIRLKDPNAQLTTTMCLSFFNRMFLDPMLYKPGWNTGVVPPRPRMQMFIPGQVLLVGTLKNDAAQAGQGRPVFLKVEANTEFLSTKSNLISLEGQLVDPRRVDFVVGDHIRVDMVVQAAISADKALIPFLDTWNTDVAIYNARCQLLSFVGTAQSRATLEITQKARKGNDAPYGYYTASHHYAANHVKFLDYSSRVCKTLERLRTLAVYLESGDHPVEELLSNDIEFGSGQAQA